MAFAGCGKIFIDKCMENQCNWTCAVAIKFLFIILSVKLSTDHEPHPSRGKFLPTNIW